MREDTPPALKQMGLDVILVSIAAFAVFLATRDTFLVLMTAVAVFSIRFVQA